MARISGVDLPRNKRLDIALTYLHGIGRATAQKMLESINVDPSMKTDAMDETIVAKIRDYIEKGLAVEG